jgi:hypothetical protein
MSTNRYFNHFSYAREQDLVEDLIIESTKIYGHDVKYLPRTIVDRDDLYGEDRLSTFNAAAEVEMYIKNVDAFEGEGTILSRFGLEMRDEITFTIARKRWNQIRQEKLLTEIGYNLLQETANTNQPSRQFLSTPAQTFGFLLEEGTGDGYQITSERPMEGDLIYFPMVDKLFEIKFVEHEEIFYQTGRLQTYDLRCELFEYSSERIDTGDAVIDAIEDNYSNDLLFYQFTLEDDSGVLLTEDGDTLLQESTLNTTDSQANNSVFRSEILADDILDFSESNPWGEGQGW